MDIEKQGLLLLRHARTTRIIVEGIQAWRAENAPPTVVHADARIISGDDKVRTTPRAMKHKGRIGGVRVR